MKSFCVVLHNFKFFQQLNTRISGPKQFLELKHLISMVPIHWLLLKWSIYRPLNNVDK